MRGHQILIHTDVIITTLRIFSKILKIRRNDFAKIVNIYKNEILL